MNKMINYEFPILSINKKEYGAVQNWIINVAPNLSDKKIYIFGAGIRGSMFLKILREANIEVAGFGDNAKEKQGAFVKEYPIFSMDEICADLENNVILIATENYVPIEKMLVERGCKRDINYYVIENSIYDDFYHEFFRNEKIEYICFGDCFFTEIDVDDLSGKTMGELIKEELGNEETKVLSMHGMCIPHFYYLMQEQLRMGIKPKAVTFIVNIPFCNGIQTKLPQSQHSVLLKRIEENLPEKSESFSQYVRLTERRSENINAKAFSSNKSRNNVNVEMLLTRTRYMYELKEDNENIEYLKKMIALLLEHNIKPVPFIPALNYFSGVEWFGKDFLERYTKICEGIKRTVSAYDVEIVDMSMILDKSCFTGDRMTKFPGINGKMVEIKNISKEMLA